MEQDPKSSRGAILWGRVGLVGERIVPPEALENLSQSDWRGWMTEPHPDKFPPQMHHLKAWLETD